MENLFDVQWSPRLEDLADGLLNAWRFFWQGDPAADPFGKICVVTDTATERWLKEYFLLDKKIPQILLNVDFVRLPEFLNDWLAAATRGIEPWQRQTAEHPYSPDVLTWRIYRILARSNDADLQVLREYAGDDPLRRYALSQKLARLYDDYLNSRCQMLRNWETGWSNRENKIPDWQIFLYRKLYDENPQSYAADYEKAFRSSAAKVADAFHRAFPQYRKVEVFDLSFMTEPALHLLEKIAEAVPLTFRIFNPSRVWLGDTRSQQEIIRDIRQQRATLQSGDFFEQGDDTFSSRSPEETLLGAFASGARALIQRLCGDSQGNVDPGEINLEDGIPIDLPEKISLFSNYSPRRELEVLKDGLLHYFKETPGIPLRRALVLCADWETYAPIMESVFSSDPRSEGYIPITIAGSTIGDTPFGHSFQDLLSFRENRFEVSAVFNLLEYPSVLKKFDLGGNAVSQLRDMVKKANIHWGFNDEDVRDILKAGSPQPDAPCYAFTWQRGFDRLIAEFLYGFPEKEYTLLTVGKLNELHPCGNVEGDRAKSAARLWDLVTKLSKFRRDLAPGKEYEPQEMRDILLNAIETFYMADSDAERKDASRVQQAIVAVAANMASARLGKISAEVFIAALQAAQNAALSGRHSSGDAVLFAPLNCANVSPRELIWVCGLNDGKFPKIEYRSSYDIIGKYPSRFDVSAREKDSFALLKAVLSARRAICLSYVGKDNSTDKDLPPSMSLEALKYFFEKKKIRCDEYQMPLFAYSSRYFKADQKTLVPPSFSRENENIARVLEKRSKPEGPIPFSLSSDEVTEIDFEKLVTFFSSPNRFLFEQDGITVPEVRYDKFYDEEPFSARLDDSLEKSILLNRETPDDRTAGALVESGKAPDRKSAQEEIENLKLYAEKISSYAEAYRRFQEAEKAPADAVVDLALPDGRQVRIHLRYAVIDSNAQKTMIFFESYCSSETTHNRILLRHLGANAVLGDVTTRAIGSKGSVISLKPQSIDEAKEKLSRIIKRGASELPADFPDYRHVYAADDKLPQKWQDELKGIWDSCVEEKRKKKKNE